VVEAADKFDFDRFKPLADGTIIDDGDRRIVEVNLSTNRSGSSEFASTNHGRCIPSEFSGNESF